MAWCGMIMMRKKPKTVYKVELGRKKRVYSYCNIPLLCGCKANSNPKPWKCIPQKVRAWWFTFRRKMWTIEGMDEVLRTTMTTYMPYCFWWWFRKPGMMVIWQVKGNCWIREIGDLGLQEEVAIISWNIMDGNLLIGSHCRLWNSSSKNDRVIMRNDKIGRGSIIPCQSCVALITAKIYALQD